MASSSGPRSSGTKSALMPTAWSCDWAIRSEFAGHLAMHASVVGYANRQPTVEETRRMQRLLDQALEHGAIGVLELMCWWQADGLLEQVVGLARRLAAQLGLPTPAGSVISVPVGDAEAV